MCVCVCVYTHTHSNYSTVTLSSLLYMDNYLPPLQKCPYMKGEQESGDTCERGLTEYPELLAQSVFPQKCSYFCNTIPLEAFFHHAVYANWVADLDTASNSCPLAQVCNFKAHHREPVKNLVCNRAEMRSRSTKDSLTLLISGGRNENCVQSL